MFLLSLSETPQRLVCSFEQACQPTARRASCSTSPNFNLQTETRLQVNLISMRPRRTFLEFMPPHDTLGAAQAADACHPARKRHFKRWVEEQRGQENLKLCQSQTRRRIGG